MSQLILNIIPKYVQINHVTHDMHDTPMQKLRAHESMPMVKWIPHDKGRDDGEARYKTIELAELS